MDSNKKAHIKWSNINHANGTSSCVVAFSINEDIFVVERDIEWPGQTLFGMAEKQTIITTVEKSRELWHTLVKQCNFYKKEINTDNETN